MGQNNSNPFQEGGEVMNQYEIKDRAPDLCITYLKQKNSGKQYLLRQITFNELRQFTIQCEKYQKRKLLSHPNITNLERVEDRTEDQMCSNFYKIYTLWEYPLKNLTDQIALHQLQSKRFQNKELRQILASSIKGLSYMQQNGYSHERLTTKSILLAENIKVCDPLTTGSHSNIQCIFNNTSTRGVYLSPEQCESIETQKLIPNKNAYKNDVFTMAMIVLECGLLEKQDKCYQDDCSRVNWPALNTSLKKFSENYDPQLAKVLSIMTEKDINQRPDWISLAKHLDSRKSNSQLPVSTVVANPIKNVPTTAASHQSHQAKLQPQVVYNEKNFHNYLPLSSGPFVIPSVPHSANIMVQNDRLYNNNISIPPLHAPIKVQNQTNQVPITIGYQNPTLPPYSNRPLLAQSNNNFMTTFGRPQQLGNQHIQPPEIIRQIGSEVRTFRNDNPRTIQSNLPNAIPLSLGQHIKPVEIRYQPQLYQPHPPSGQENKLDQNPKYIYEEFKMGSRYEGYKLNGMRHGQGKFFYQDGGRYEGEWLHNKMNGRGRLYYQSDKLAYDGQWLDDQFHGFGKLYNQRPEAMQQGFDYRNFDQIDQSWDFYQGFFEEDMKNGKGKLKFSNGQWFDGNFKNDMVEGEGDFWQLGGRKIHGIWSQNHLVHNFN